MFSPNPNRAEKIAFLSGLTVLSVPATYGEAFGLYVLEALAAGVPVVQPRHGAFPEILAATGGGILCEPNDPRALADAFESLLLDPTQARALGEQGQIAVRENHRRSHGARNLAGLRGPYGQTLTFGVIPRISDKRCRPEHDSPTMSSPRTGENGDEVARV